MRKKQAGEKGLSKGRTIGEAQNFTRDLVNEPANKLTPKILAEKAEAMAKEAGLAVEILDEKKITDLKMGALLSVAQGGPEPPRVMVLTYMPANVKPDLPVIGLIGKAVTFDTGGISIKPADGMEKMKYDMAGGGAMLGVMRAIASLKPNVKVICVVPSTENMVGGKAQKPGDIQTAMSGKTIEVLNTDAEGRLILADGITFAKQLGATHLIDAATLNWRNRRGSVQRQRRRFRLRPGLHRQTSRQLKSGRRENVADAYRRRLSRIHQGQRRRHSEYRQRQRRRSHHRRYVHQGIHRRYSMDSSRHRRHGLERRPKTVDGQRRDGNRRAHLGPHADVLLDSIF